MDLEQVKKTLERRYEARRAELESRRRALLSTLEKNIEGFVGEFPAVTKIVVFGSLVRPGYFRDYSDIDVVVWNLPNSEYWRAISWFEDCLDTERIDLVRIEDAHPRMIKYIEMGEIIYEKEVRRTGSTQV